MPHIALSYLDPHPANANVMPPEVLNKIARHIQRTGDYPPLIVRRHPVAAERFQILDGHHRALVLKRLGHDHARCEIWEGVSDERAALLLLTLNRLHGEDDPRRRGALLEELAQAMPLEDLAALVPDDQERIARLMELNHDPPPIAEPPDVNDLPQAVTFFLTGAQRDRLLEKLEAVSRDRTRALLTLLEV